MSLMVEKTHGHLYAASFAGFCVSETGMRSGCPNAHRLLWSRLGAWTVPAAESLGAGILVARVCALISLLRDNVKPFSAQKIV